MSDDEPEPALPSPALWTPGQRRAVALLVAALATMLIVQTVRRRVYVPENRPPAAGQLANSDDAIDPNQADWQTLACIPSLGEKRAQLIVAYRQQYVAAHGPAAIAYQSAADLRHVKGIGPATVSNLTPYLLFPTTAPANRPASTR